MNRSFARFICLLATTVLCLLSPQRFALLCSLCLLVQFLSSLIHFAHSLVNQLRGRKRKIYMKYDIMRQLNNEANISGNTLSARDQLSMKSNGKSRKAKSRAQTKSHAIRFPPQEICVMEKKGSNCPESEV